MATPDKAFEAQVELARLMNASRRFTRVGADDLADAEYHYRRLSHSYDEYLEQMDSDGIGIPQLEQETDAHQGTQ